jgi:hypothetical protein
LDKLPQDGTCEMLSVEFMSKIRANRNPDFRRDLDFKRQKLVFVCRGALEVNIGVCELDSGKI